VNGASSDTLLGRLIQDGPHDGAFNMAADLYLADLAGRSGEAILRLYSWDVPTLSLGFHQRISEDVLSKWSRAAIPVVRRPTGGRAVLHDQELTYALALPANHALLRVGREKLMQDIGCAFVTAALTLGLKAEVVRCGSDRSLSLQKGSLLCFQSISRWEVRLGGRKWIGSAQRLFSNAFLQHGSIHLEISDVSGELTAVTAGSPHGPFTIIDEMKLRQAIPEALQRRWNLVWREARFDSGEMAQINARLGEIDFVQPIKRAS